MTVRPSNHPLTLFPASMLKDQRRRLQMASHMSSSGYLLVSTLNNPKQTQLLLRLGMTLQRRGANVSVLSL